MFSKFGQIFHVQILLRELGSDEAVQEAVRGNGGRWRGRAERIDNLEAEIVRLKKSTDGGDKNHSSKMFDSRINSLAEELLLQESTL
jgi:hypothetical protein